MASGWCSAAIFSGAFRLITSQGSHNRKDVSCDLDKLPRRRIVLNDQEIPRGFACPLAMRTGVRSAFDPEMARNEGKGKNGSKFHHPGLLSISSFAFRAVRRGAQVNRKSQACPSVAAAPFCVKRKKERFRRSAVVVRVEFPGPLSRTSTLTWLST